MFIIPTLKHTFFAFINITVGWGGMQKFEVGSDNYKKGTKYLEAGKLYAPTIILNPFWKCYPYHHMHIKQ